MKAKFIAAIIGALSATASAGDREIYNARAANSDMALFREIDINHDGKITRAATKGVVSMEARFDDIDIDHDDEISLNEMRRYIEHTYAVQAR